MISRSQGKLDAAVYHVRDALHIYALANADAVHFSTKLEGNPLTYEQVTGALESKKKIAGQSRDLKEVLNYALVRAFLFAQALKLYPKPPSASRGFLFV